MGFFSRKSKKADQNIQFQGIPGQISTVKCLVMAGIKGISLDPVFNTENPANQNAAYQYTSDNKKLPSLNQGDVLIAGPRAIITYIDIKGKGVSLIPRKARILGLQNYWIELCNDQLAPIVQALIDQQATEEQKEQCKRILASLNDVLANDDFVAGPLSLADANVAAYIYVLKSHGMDLNEYTNIGKWIDRIEATMPSELKEKYVPILTTKSSQQDAA